MSGFNDPDKLRDAIELARSFGLAKDKKPAARGSNSSGLQNQQNQNFRPRTPFAQAPPHRTNQPTIPPPSMRNPNSSSSFFTPSMRNNTGKAPVIGSSGLDFLRRQDVKQPAAASTAAHANKAVRPAAASDFSTKQTANLQTAKDNASAVAPRADPEPTPNDMASNNGSAGNILDTFYALVSKRSSIGQQIEEITHRLPDAMDLNGSGKSTPPISSDDATSGSEILICTCLNLGMSNRDSSASALPEKPCPIHGNAKINLGSFAMNYTTSEPKGYVNSSSAQGIQPQTGESLLNLTSMSGETPHVSHATSIPKSSVQSAVNTKENTPLSKAFSGTTQASQKQSKGLSGSMWAA